MYSAVFFDRDGIINKYVEPTPRTKEEIVINDGIKETIQKLRNLGYKIVIVTNQPDIDRGLITSEDTEEIHKYLAEELGTDGILIARSSDDKDPFRKPNPGMLLKAAKDMDIHLPSSFMVGDSWKDMAAGKRAGCKTIFLLTEYNSAQLVSQDEIIADKIIASLDGIYEVIFFNNYQRHYFSIASYIAWQFASNKDISQLVEELRQFKQGRKGRLFILGVGGSAGNASHATCDFRKLAGIETYTVTDNVSGLTASINDSGWNSSFKEYLVASRFSHNDAVLVLSVGGGSKERHLSENIIEAVDYAKDVCGLVLGIVGKKDSHTEKVAQCCVTLPFEDKYTLTPIAESIQSLIWHMLVTHPLLNETGTTW